MSTPYHLRKCLVIFEVAQFDRHAHMPNPERGEKVKFALLILFGIAGGLAGASYGLLQAGLGGAIVGVVVGVIGGFVAGGLFVALLQSALATAIVCGGIALVVWVISSLWGVGKP